MVQAWTHSPAVDLVSQSGDGFMTMLLEAQGRRHKEGQAAFLHSSVWVVSLE